MRTAIISSTITVVLLVGLVLGLNYFSGPKGQRSVLQRRGDFLDMHVRLPLPWLFSDAQAKPNKLVYLNREGATLFGGGDDATTNRATLAGPKPNDVIRIPGFRGSYARWQSIVKCVQGAFAPFDVEIVDQRPVGQDYMMVVFGGRPTVLKKRQGQGYLRATGLAPYNGLPIQNAAVLVFTRAMAQSARLSCETAAHEIGHGYGLDHGYHCRDFMTYLGYCGKKRFMNKDLRCGEHKKRDCKGGKPTQNSYQQLANILGLKKK